MTAPALVFKEIHRLMSHAAELEKRVAQGPRNLKAQQLALARQEENLQAAQDHLKHLKVGILEKEASIKATQAQIAKHEKSEISNKKEYDALRAEVAACNQTIRKIEDEILEAMAEVEDQSKKIPEAEKAVAKAKDDVARAEQDLAEKMERWKQEREKALAELAEIEKNLPEEARKEYQPLVASMGHDAIAGVQPETRTCRACYTEITQDMFLKLKRGDLMQCKNCARMLYLAD